MTPIASGVMVSERELRQKRVYVGLLAVLCLVGAVATMWLDTDSTGLQGALMRVGMLLTAFWLALPTKDRPSAWRGLSSNWALVGGVILAIAIPRLRAMFPLLAVFAGIAWFARPRK